MREVKEALSEFLNQKDFKEKLDRIHQFPPKKAINAIFTFLYSSDEIIKENAVLAMGEVVSKLAIEDVEYARVIMRRLMWSLNDESGGIGWGAPLAMGEIMARSDKMAEEYHKILISYVIEDRNPLEFKELQKEAVLGLQRLYAVRPDLVQKTLI